MVSPPSSRGLAITVPPCASAIDAHDRQAEAAAPVGAEPVAVQPPERLEDRLDLVRRHRSPVLATTSSTWSLRCRVVTQHLALGVVVPDRVLHQVLDQPLQQHRVAAVGAGVQQSVDGHPALRRLLGRLVQHVLRHVGQVHRDAGPAPSARPRPASSRPSMSRSCRALTRSSDSPSRLTSSVASGRRDRHLDQRAVDRQRGAQLVRGVGDEAPLAVEGAVEPARAWRRTCRPAPCISSCGPVVARSARSGRGSARPGARSR